LDSLHICEISIDFIFHSLDIPFVHSSLTTNSQMYSRYCNSAKYYYETIQVSVAVTGNYSLSRYSNDDTCGYIYKNHFDPLKPTENLLSKEDYSACSVHLKLVTLQAKITYILIVTTFFPKVIASILTVAWGPNNVTLESTSEYICCLLHNQY
jgi:hypothetical protein